MTGRFVILLHETPETFSRGRHWDLMLEADGALWTWAINEQPCIGITSSAERLTDHRLAYLDYEGPISKNRGQVTRWDRGHYRLHENTSSHIHVVLNGNLLCCCVTLDRISFDSPLWQISFYNVEEVDVSN